MVLPSPRYGSMPWRWTTFNASEYATVHTCEQRSLSPFHISLHIRVYCRSLKLLFRVLLLLQIMWGKAFQCAPKRTEKRGSFCAKLVSLKKKNSLFQFNQENRRQFQAVDEKEVFECFVALELETGRGFLSLYKLYIYREKTVYSTTHKTAINWSMDHAGEM